MPMVLRRCTLSERPAALAPHFDDIAQQSEASHLGMWVFLLTEIMFFGGMFTGYAVYRSVYAVAFAAGSHHLVLISSSLTMVLAVHAAQVGQRQLLVGFLLLTMLLGLVFLGLKTVEYTHKFADHLVPGSGFLYAGPHARQVQLFFSFYFGMTGMHALHMIIGIGLLTVLVWLAWRNRFSPMYYTPIEIVGLYWHFVDIVWIFLFPLLYLIGRH